MVQPGSATRPAPLLSTGLSTLQRQFRTSTYWSIRQLVCEIDREQVVLRGTVPSYYLKQVAQSLALKAVGVDHLHSDIDVQPEKVISAPQKTQKTGNIVIHLS